MSYVPAKPNSDASLHVSLLYDLGWFLAWALLGGLVMASGAGFYLLCERFW